MKRLGIMLAAILSLTVATQAADLGWNAGASPIYSPTPATGWEGFYAGVNGGFGWGTLTREPAGGGVETQNNSNGWNLGAQAGYNVDLGGAIVGIEGDLQWTNVGYSEEIPGIGSFKSGIDFYGTLRGRAGMALGQVMPYVTGGFAAGRGTASVTNGVGVTTSQSATHMGWTAGVGLEAQATSNISIKAEYLYVDLGTQTYGGPLAGLGGIDATQRFSVVRAGLNYKF